MDLRTKTALEFDKITGLLAEKCVTDAARQQALALEPEQNLTLLEKKLRQTDYFGVLSDDLYVLLPNTDDEDAEGVIARFKKEGFESTIVHTEDVVA